MLLMAMENNEQHDALWFLDSGCSNHMTGRKHWFTQLDDSFNCNVKLGNGMKLEVLGKGTIKVKNDGIVVVIQDVYYFPGLQNNLFSIGQMQEKALIFLIKQGTCKVFHENKGLLFTTSMKANRMFVLQAISLGSKVAE